jgi:hypothetical protein
VVTDAARSLVGKTGVALRAGDIQPYYKVNFCEYIISGIR